MGIYIQYYQQPAKRTLTNIEAGRKKALFIVVFVPIYTRLHPSFGHSAHKTAKFPLFKFIKPWSTSRPQKIDMILDIAVYSYRHHFTYWTSVTSGNKSR